MKKNIVWIMSLAIAAVFILSGCGTNTSAAGFSEHSQVGLDAGKASADYPGSAVATRSSTSTVESIVTSVQEQNPRPEEHMIVPTGVLSEAEIAGLNYMREEEKLAGDVYQKLYELWGLSAFQNIARSEAVHANSVLSVLQAYGLEDPSAGLQTGEFYNPDLKALYDTLVVRGSQSLEDALRVGAEIEEIDIIDLQNEMSIAQNLSIQQIYSNLLAGSSNHLRSFTRLLQNQTGEIYQPIHLSDNQYQNILADMNGSQRQGGMGKDKGNMSQVHPGVQKNQGGYGQGQGGNGQGQGSQGKGKGGNGQGFYQPAATPVVQ